MLGQIGLWCWGSSLGFSGRPQQLGPGAGAQQLGFGVGSQLGFWCWIPVEVSVFGHHMCGTSYLYI